MDIFEYWRDVPPTARVHPDDQAILAATAHGFDLRCLPGQMAGLLPSAPVVLLFLSGGRSDEFDIRMAESQERVAEHGKRRLGLLPLWGPEEHRDAWNWWTRVTRSFGYDWQALRTTVAILNIGAYKSKIVDGRDRQVLERLPSARVVREWTKGVLFPQAVRGERVVICLRSQRLWGLAPGTRQGQALFAPDVNRGGHMLHGPMRQAVIAGVREILGAPRK